MFVCFCIKLVVSVKIFTICISSKKLVHISRSVVMTQFGHKMARHRNYPNITYWYYQQNFIDFCNINQCMFLWLQYQSNCRPWFDILSLICGLGQIPPHFTIWLGRKQQRVNQEWDLGMKLMFLLYFVYTLEQTNDYPKHWHQNRTI